jgi:hypothetical protein
LSRLILYGMIGYWDFFILDMKSSASALAFMFGIPFIIGPFFWMITLERARQTWDEDYDLNIQEIDNYYPGKPKHKIDEIILYASSFQLFIQFIFCFGVFFKLQVTFFLREIFSKVSIIWYIINIEN